MEILLAAEQIKDWNEKPGPAAAGNAQILLILSPVNGCSNNSYFSLIHRTNEKLAEVLGGIKN